MSQRTRTHAHAAPTAIHRPAQANRQRHRRRRAQPRHRPRRRRRHCRRGQADSYSWPAAKAGETCYSFDRTPFYNDPARVSGQTNGPVLVKLQGQYDSGHNWLVSSSGDPLATITVFANGGYQDRTGQTTLNGDYSADIMAANICTKAAPGRRPDAVRARRVEDADLGRPADAELESRSRAYFTKIDLATKDLNALDAQLTECNTQYQVDLYKDSATTSRSDRRRQALRARTIRPRTSRRRPDGT